MWNKLIDPEMKCLSHTYTHTHLFSHLNIKPSEVDVYRGHLFFKGERTGQDPQSFGGIPSLYTTEGEPESHL